METQTQTPINQQGGSSYTASDGSKLDPTAVTLAKAIRKTESNGDYNAVGDNGDSHGAYQFNKGNYAAWAPKYGIDPNDMSPTSQDKVAYGRMKELLDKGRSQSEVAAIWNGARLVNGKYEAINPDYVTKVKGNYESAVQSGNQGYNPTPYSNPTNGIPLDTRKSIGVQNPEDANPTLSSQLVKRTNDIGGVVENTLSGKINPLSGIIQTGGAIAGGIGDIANKGMEMIPGVKQLENLLGQGVGQLAKTDLGKAVAQNIKSFTEKHPELSADIGAGFNILTAIPILKGFGVVKNITMDAASQALKSVAVKGFEKDLAASATTKAAQRYFSKDVVDTMIKEGAVPDLENVAGQTKLNTKVAEDILSKKIGHIDENILQPALESVTKPFPIKDVKSIAQVIAVDNLSNPKGVSEIINRITAKYGKNILLKDLNQAKREIGRKISEAKFGDPDLSNMRIAYKALQTAVEVGGDNAGISNIAEINKSMKSLINAQNFLGEINGKIVPKRGMVHGMINAASTAVGNFAGNMVNLPFAGALAGQSASGAVENALSGLTPRAMRAGIIKRTSANAVKTPLNSKVKAIAGMGVAGQLQNK